MRVHFKQQASATPFVAVAVGSQHTLLLSCDRNVYAFGGNGVGQLGVGDRHDRSLPTQVEMLAGRGVFSIAAGARHSVALSDRGLVYVWGNGDSGQLGLPTDAVDSVALPQIVESFLGLGPAMVRGRVGACVTNACARADVCAGRSCVAARGRWSGGGTARRLTRCRCCTCVARRRAAALTPSSPPRRRRTWWRGWIAQTHAAPHSGTTRFES